MGENLFHQSAVRVLKDDLPMVRKSLILGLGGSGMKGILSGRNYIEKNMPAEARRYLRWIGIDTTDIGTSIEGKGGSYRFPGDQQFYQDDQRMLYIGTPTPADLSIEYLRKLRTEDPAYRWLPDPDVFNISTRSGQGANQTRALGRLAFFHNFEKIRNTLIKEKEMLESLSNDPKYFRLMDVQEQSQPEVMRVVIRPEAGRNRYYIDEQIPRHHDVLKLTMDEQMRSILCPHLPPEDVHLRIFPRDEKGSYFEISPERAPKEMVFELRHAPRAGQISIFITGSVVGGTGNGMILDMAALIRDIFKDTWPQPKIYGVIVLPSAFKRVVYNRNARANAYAALKEFDYFMSGNPFQAIYPGGHTIRFEDRIFNDGMLYLLDVENLSGNVLQDRDQVQELTGQFIYTFVASTAGGAIEERMVNDSTRTNIYYPLEGAEPKRRASYNSFGISRVMYPAPQMRDIGFRLVSMKVIRSFYSPVNVELLKETFGDLSRGLVRALRLNAKLIFQRMYPDYRMDWQAEFNPYRDRLARALQKKDANEVYSILELLNRDYGRGEMENHKSRMLRRMESRWKLELEKAEQVMRDMVATVTKDPKRGFLFCQELIKQIFQRLESYQAHYYKCRVGLQFYADSEISKLLGELEQKADAQKAEAVYQMVRTNHLQLMHETMLQASEEFIRDMKSVLYRLRNELLNPLDEKLRLLSRRFEEEVQSLHFELLQKINPLFFYLVNKDEIKNFVNRYFAARISVDDLCNEVDFLAMDRGDDTFQIVQTWLIGKKGIAVLELSEEELNSLIVSEAGADILDKKPDEARDILYNAEKTSLQIDEATMTEIEIETLRLGLYKIIRKRFEGFNFESISIEKVLSDRKIPLKNLLEKLDGFSRPYITVDASGLKAMEYYRTISRFAINVFEEGDTIPEKSKNDLPSRMDHYLKRQQAELDISVECFELPNLCKPYEIMSVGVGLGLPLYRMPSLKDSEADYHAVIAERAHPLHIFNDAEFDAKYFPDPFRWKNYINPAQLWKGLVHYELVVKNAAGAYEYDATLHDDLRRITSGSQYRKSVEGAFSQIEQSGGVKSMDAATFAKALASLGYLKKNSSGQIGFRKDYDRVIRDILDGDGTGDRATAAGLSKEAYIEKHIPSPVFASIAELVKWTLQQTSVQKFLMHNMERIQRETAGNEITGAAINVPDARLAEVKLPVYRDEIDFYDYFQAEGSLEWQNYLKGKIVERIDAIVRRYRKAEDPTLPDRAKIDQYLVENAERIPFVAAWEVRVNHRVIR